MPSPADLAIDTMKEEKEEREREKVTETVFDRMNDCYMKLTSQLVYTMMNLPAVVTAGTSLTNY